MTMFHCVSLTHTLAYNTIHFVKCSFISHVSFHGDEVLLVDTSSPELNKSALTPNTLCVSSKQFGAARPIYMCLLYTEQISGQKIQR